MTVVCPACGRNVPVSDDGYGTVPAVVVCAGCGKRVRLAEPAAAAVSPGGSEWDELGSAAAAFAPPVRRAKRRPVIWPWVAAAVVACGVGAAYVAVRMVQTPTPQPVAVTDHVPAPTARAGDDGLRQRLIAAKADGDAAAMAGDWRAAHAVYGRVLAMAATAGAELPADRATLELVQAARDGQRQALGALIQSRQSDRPTTVAVAPPPVPVPTVPSPATGPTTVPGAVPETVDGATRPAGPAAVVTAADAAPPVANPPPPPALHAYAVTDVVTDAEIGQAIDKGIAFLRRQFANGELVVNVSADSSFNGAYTAPGLDALCVYALLHAAEASDQRGAGAKDPVAVQLLERLKRYKLDYTYHRSLRAAALAVYDRMADHAALEADVRWLVQAQRNGGYTYTMPSGQLPDGAWDNSNSQYGLLGVWSGAQQRVAVGEPYWQAVQRHWMGCQNRDGTWGYIAGDRSLSMTLAGAASMLVSRDYLDAPAALGAGADRSPRSVSTEAVLAWLDAGDDCMPQADGLWPAYTRYGLERVGLASGYKYFGRHDWYTEVAADLVGRQRADGSWPGVENAGAGAVGGPPDDDGGGGGRGRRGGGMGGGRGGPPANRATSGDELVETAYDLLFLARGRHPILYNKLRYDGDWNDRPQEVAHLARFASKQIERPMNWQVVNLRHQWWDWCDSPVLYIGGDRPPKVTDADLGAIRDFALAGGLVFTHADGGRDAFTAWAKQAARKMFPAYELTRVPRDHPMNGVVFPLKNPPPLLSLSNGSRVMMVHSPTDVSRGWQLNWTDANKGEFDLGLNLFVYAAGKGEGLRNRLSSTYVPACPRRAAVANRVVRLRYPSAAWEPEPYAWTRFARYFQWDTREAVEPDVVDCRALRPVAAPLAVLTGTVRYDFTAAEVAAVRAYVEAGGVLLVDACGGQADFARSVDALLAAAFPGGEAKPVTEASPVLVPSRPGADDLRKPMLRPYAVENGGRDLPMRELAWGRGRVIYSRLDLTTGLLGTESWGILGYRPAYAQAVVKNAVLWAGARSAELTASAR